MKIVIQIKKGVLAMGEFYNFIHLFVEADFPPEMIRKLSESLPEKITLLNAPRFTYAQGSIFVINCMKTIPLKQLLDILVKFCNENEIKLIKE